MNKDDLLTVGLSAVTILLTVVAAYLTNEEEESE